MDSSGAINAISDFTAGVCSSSTPYRSRRPQHRLPLSHAGAAMVCIVVPFANKTTATVSRLQTLGRPTPFYLTSTSDGFSSVLCAECPSLCQRSLESTATAPAATRGEPLASSLCVWYSSVTLSVNERRRAAGCSSCSVASSRHTIGSSVRENGVQLELHLVEVPLPADLRHNRSEQCRAARRHSVVAAASAAGPLAT